MMSTKPASIVLMSMPLGRDSSRLDPVRIEPAPIHERPLDVPVVQSGGLPIAVLDRSHSAELMVEAAIARRGSRQRPLFCTSANGQVLSMCARDAELRDLMLQADLIHADGMPMVFASRFLHSTPLPERVATTDLFHDIAAVAQHRGARFFLLGASKAVVDRTVQCVRTRYPDLEIVGHHCGFLRRAGDEERIIDEINEVRPDILWLGLGFPREHRFAMRHRDALRNVGVIKTSGGLFDFLSGKNPRAPGSMYQCGLEWAYRIYLEPRRLAFRYLVTNPHAAFLLLTKSRQTVPSMATHRTGYDATGVRPKMTVCLASVSASRRFDDQIAPWVIVGMLRD